MLNSKNAGLSTAIHAVLFGLGAVSTGVMAAEPAAAPFQIDEVVVSAQKREESIQEIPKQVQVVAMEALENNNVTNIEQLVKLVPSMNGNNGGGRTSMRGVGTAAPTIGAESKVGISVDGIPIPSRSQGLRELVDIAQLEVLPGPQGTLQGRNAIGGLINIVTTRPSQDGFRAKVEAKFTDDHERGYEAFVTGPINDQLAFSLALNDQFQRGLGYNLATNRWDVAKDLTSARGKLLWTPSDVNTFTFTYMFASLKNEGGGSQGMARIYTRLDPAPNQMWSSLERVPGAGPGGIVPTNSPVGKTPFNVLYPGLYERIGPDNVTYYSANPGGKGTSQTDRETQMATATWDHDFSAGTLTILGSWFNEEFPALQNYLDYPWGNLALRPDFTGYADIFNYSKQNTAEVRFVSDATGEGFSYIVGAYWSDGENRYDYDRRYLPFDADRRFGTTGKALFASGTYDFSQGTTVRAGLRYQMDDIDYTWVYNDLPATSKTLTNGLVIPFVRTFYPSTSANTDDSYVNYDFSVQHRLTDDLMIYANYAVGNQGPIYDSEFIEGSQSGVPLEALPAEEVTSIEAGVKSTLLDGRLVLNANVYDMDFKNYQAVTNVTDPTNPTSQPILKTYAAGSVISRGLELSATAYLTDSFRLDLVGTIGEAEIADWPNAPCYGAQTAAQGCIVSAAFPAGIQPNIKGNRLQDAAEHRVTAIGTYSGELNLLGGMDYNFSVTVANRSDVWQDQLGNPESYRPERTDVDLNLTLRRGPLSVSLFGVNVNGGGELTYAAGLGGALTTNYPGFTTANALRPNLNRDLDAYYGIRASYEFGDQ